MKNFYWKQSWALFIPLTLSLGVAGCLKNLPTLVRVEEEKAGANCTHGGYAVHSGTDENKNGILEAGEDTGLAYICHSAPRVVRQHIEPAGKNCTSGGVAVETGADLNSNGILDNNEVTKTSYVCNGSDGVSGTAYNDDMLTTADNEPAGAHCTVGGIALKSGRDTNGNGVLDATEVKSTTYVCNGLNGTDGKYGHSSLTRIENEAPGSNCQFGGAAILSGLDLDDNKTLEATEILNTAYVCEGSPDIHYGDLDVLYYGSELDAVKHYGEITGRLKIWYMPPNVQIGLPFLRSVGGLDLSSLYTDPNTPFAFPYLTDVAGNFSFTENDTVTTLNSFMALKRIGGSAIFYSNDSLISMEGFNPQEVGNAFSIAKAPLLVNIDISSLERSKSFYLTDLPAAKYVSFYQLQSVPFLMSFSRCASLNSVSFPSLTELGGLSVDETPMNFTGFTALQSINGLLYTSNNPAGFSFNGLQKVTKIGGLAIKNHPELTSLTGLNGLREINGDVTITGNPKLSDVSALKNVRFINGNLTISQNAIKTCSLSALLNQLTAAGTVITGTVSVTGISGTCP